MSDKSLGSEPDAPGVRDAVHVAIISAIADGKVRPGNHVGLIPGTNVVNANETLIGIVDPFRSGPISNGEHIWIVLYPGSVKNLRHHWDHPDLTETGAAVEDYDDECRGC